MRPFATVLLCVAFSTCAVANVAVAGLRGVSACVPDSVVVDTSVASEGGELIWGMAWGETFTAVDTLIQSVTAWRIPSEHNNPSELKFWITEVDAGGTPHTHLVVYDGPTLSFASPDSVHPTPITYTFNPPISLPRPSVYCFWIQEVCTGYADLLVALSDDYPGGHLWQTFRSDFDGCILRDYPDPSFSGEDLVFTIVFCDTHSTPVRNSSWGQLKARYR